MVGRTRYMTNRDGAEPTNYFLRRAIHRIEKGLMMRPQKEVFALDYIEDAAVAYRQGVELGLDDEELAWASAVLVRYFDSVGEHPTIERAREVFEEAKRGVESLENAVGENYVPYRREPDGRPVSISNLHALARQRRSVRWYQQRPVPRDLIEEALKVAALSPSACNRQPLEFRIYEDAETIQRLATLPMGTTGFAQNIPALSVLVGRLRAYPHPRDRHVIYIDGGLAAMSFMFALETVGLASCPINWPDIEDRESRMSQELGLERDERVIMLISIGYPDPNGLVAASRKVALRHLATFHSDAQY